MNKQVAGRFTDTLPQSLATWFPLQTATSVMGVLGLRLAGESVKMDFIQAVSQAEVLEKSERLRRNLLDSVSHELKIPLAVIRASIEGMGAVANNSYVVEIDTARKRLQRLVDGLLQMTRLESQVVEPQLEWCDVNELVEAALKSAGDSPVELTVRHAEQKLRLTVRDHCPGLPPGEEGRVFGKFYLAPGAPAGGTGLGLSIARGFVQALGGDLAGWNHPQGGAVFEILLKADFLAQEADSACAPERIAESSDA